MSRRYDFAMVRDAIRRAETVQVRADDAFHAGTGAFYVRVSKGEALRLLAFIQKSGRGAPYIVPASDPGACLLAPALRTEG